MFKNRSNNSPKVLPANASLLDYRSASVTMRLGKIADHYRQLESLLTDLESKMPVEPSTPVDDQVVSEPTIRKPR